MGFFKKIYDLKRDGLEICMPLNTMIYGIFKDGEPIDLNKCNKRTKKEFDRITEEYYKRLRKRSAIVKQAGYSFDSFQILRTGKFSISKEMEELLMPMINDDNVLLGIHRVGHFADDASIKDMLDNGVELTGHGLNIIMPKPDFTLNFGIYSDNKTILKEIAYADYFKRSKGSIIICIPLEDLQEPVYVYNERRTPVINPKYIVGYFPVNESRCIDSVIYPSRTPGYEQKLRIEKPSEFNLH